MNDRDMIGIAKYLKTLKFRKKLLFGVDENDVWKKIQNLHQRYLEVCVIQEERNKALLEEKDERIRKLENTLAKFISGGGVPK